MTPVVKAKLDSILKYPFFSAVGQPLPSTVSKVDSWSHAARTCWSVKWSNSQLQARNALQGRIQARFPEDKVKHYFWHRLQEWNPLCEELRPLLRSSIDGLLTRVPLKGASRDIVKANVLGDLQRICLEAHYQDIVKPPFFIPYLDPWYAAGHFPCGWDGDEFSEEWDGVIRGKLIAF